MQITRRADYAVRTMLELSHLEEGSVALTHEVASSQGIPAPFLAKIVLSLTRAGLLRSYRGSGGGIVLARPAGQISLLQVVEAIDGPLMLSSCVSWPEECGRAGECAVHEVWREARDLLVNRLGGVTLAQLSEREGVLKARTGDGEAERREAGETGRSC